MRPRTPRTVAQATVLLEHYAELAAAADFVEGVRNVQVATINAQADAELAQIVSTLETIREKLEPWWRSGGSAVAGNRKSAELGGCMIGTRAGKPKLAHGFENDKAAAEALFASPWRKRTLRFSYALDKAATVKLLESGARIGREIAGLGFRVDQSEAFFVERAEQAGTIAP